MNIKIKHEICKIATIVEPSGEFMAVLMQNEMREAIANLSYKEVQSMRADMLRAVNITFDNLTVESGKHPNGVRVVEADVTNISLNHKNDKDSH